MLCLRKKMAGLFRAPGQILADFRGNHENVALSKTENHLFHVACATEEV